MKKLLFILLAILIVDIDMTVLIYGGKVASAVSLFLLLVMVAIAIGFVMARC